jgi:riboflavin transporter FmnP
MKNTVRITKFITVTGMLSAIAAVLYLFAEFPLLPAYPYLQYDFSEAAAIIGGIFVHPLCGVLIQVIKNIVHFIFKASAGGLGDLANLSTGLLLIVPVVFLFRKMKYFSFIMGTVCFVCGAALLNYFVFLPLYGIDPSIRAETVIYGIVPFNILKAVITSAASLVIWKVLLPYRKKLAL